MPSWIWERSKWEVLNSLNSDHNQCITTIRIRSAAQEPNDGLIWDWKNADWKSFREDMEYAAKQIETSLPTEAEELFRSAIINAGYRNKGLKKVGSTKRIWLTKEIRKVILNRDRVKPDKPNEYKKADTRVKTLMTENKWNIWKEKDEKTKKCNGDVKYNAQPPKWPSDKQQRNSPPTQLKSL